ncbi:GNAT superfamily N-acetyltransferase [Rhizobium lentis]|uniref:GNAT superfamily N-acetyltransferase n=2 Tax=Rhizobium lentis TaxID=1138194 RepID=A0A7W8UM48_9HYPH|nr:GNAT superfamily N-acetyltransferase [Rhizobium lentis]MBB5548788.1 GNAT superfamily N-acetyltransferase [Rhizobium lentis]MBB5559320.1 GNAT superfamily N-acetyltransferase [Rhizobium lentis]MBB5565157.1 GNAT superfamily N-acetyltransferase [Rhizobium lentis]
METTIVPSRSVAERLRGYPMPLAYRPARPEDLAASDALVVASINELTVRHGFGPMAMASPPNFQLFSLKDDPGGLWLAEEGREIVGFAWSWVCGDVWFLAQLFVDPARQGQGIGNALLERTLEHARKSGAAHKALITFTFNRVSQGLYIRHGLFPKMPVYFFNGERERLRRTLPQAPFRAIAIDNSAATMASIGAIDGRAIGVSREKHHRYLFDDPAITGRLLYADNDLVGYCYVGVNGHIGPLAVKRADVLHNAFATALTLAADGPAEKISAFLPGTCDSALSLAVDQGMRISFPMLLMASPGYGDWTHYLPRNPGFM